MPAQLAGIEAYFFMSENYAQLNNEPTIAGLYPELSPMEQQEAEYYLLRYFAVVKRIFERVAREHPEFLTELEEKATLRRESGQADSFE